MAGKRTKNKNQLKFDEENVTSKSTRIMQVIFVILSALIVLSMILAATVSF